MSKDIILKALKRSHHRPPSQHHALNDVVMVMCDVIFLDSHHKDEVSAYIGEPHRHFGGRTRLD